MRRDEPNTQPCIRPSVCSAERHTTRQPIDVDMDFKISNALHELLSFVSVRVSALLGNVEWSKVEQNKTKNRTIEQNREAEELNCAMITRDVV